MEEYISGEEHQRVASSKSAKPKRTISKLPLQAILVILFVAFIAFWLGTVYQKHHQPTTSLASSQRMAGTGGFSGRFSGGMRGDRVIGTVTAISSTSISVSSRMSSSKVTLSINSSTKISDNGQAISPSSIQSGNTVFITKSSSSSTSAAAILVNPSFGNSSRQSFQGSSTGSSTSSGSDTSGSGTTGSNTVIQN
jgi:hypothetical protein